MRKGSKSRPFKNLFGLYSSQFFLPFFASKVLEQLKLKKIIVQILFPSFSFVIFTTSVDWASTFQMNEPYDATLKISLKLLRNNFPSFTIKLKWQIISKGTFSHAWVFNLPRFASEKLIQKIHRKSYRDGENSTFIESALRQSVVLAKRKMFSVDCV